MTEEKNISLRLPRSNMSREKDYNDLNEDDFFADKIDKRLVHKKTRRKVKALININREDEEVELESSWLPKKEISNA